MLARKGRTLITENAYGLVQAAAGVDGSNIGSAELALLPIDPDASAASLRAGLAERLGVDVGPSSSPTRWAGRGATARPTSRSAPRVCKCCTAMRVDRSARQRAGGDRIAVADEDGRGRRPGEGQS